MDSKEELEKKFISSYEEQINFMNEFYEKLKSNNNIIYFKKNSENLIHFLNTFKIPFAILFLKKAFYEFSIRCYFENIENIQKIISIIIDIFNFDILIDKTPTFDYIVELKSLNIPYESKQIRKNLTKEEELFKKLITLEYDINELVNNNIDNKFENKLKKCYSML